MFTRKEYLSNVKTIVVKLGTQLLSDGVGRIDVPFVASIASQVASLRATGYEVTLVSSGAIGCGIRELNLPDRPTDLARLQAVAAVGQRRLMDVWAASFKPAKLPVAQLLLTREDIDNRLRFLNLRNTVSAVHELGAVPIINENDTVSTAELVKITFGDNDILAATVTHALQADLLILLSVVDGLLGVDDMPVRLIDNLKDAKSLIRQTKSPLGKGGMDSKLAAAKMVTEAGDSLIVADGRMHRILPRLLSGEDLGTLFTPAARKRSSRSRWISSVRTVGSITIDEGATRALVEQNKSLLAAGITRVQGVFSSGDAVLIANAAGQPIGRGLCNYSSEHLNLIRGKKSRQVRDILAEAAYDEVVHKDNLVLG